jgi:ABC-type glycerol-3-phosphate transport system substrate-binding protein
VVGSLFDIPAQKEAFTEAGNSDDWVVIPFPSGNQPVVDTYGPSILITRSTPAEQLAAWLVTKWLVSPQNQAEFIKMQETYPTQMSTYNYLNDIASENPQWAETQALLPDARSEPTLSSWSTMRWALQDAMKQLFDPQFNAEKIPSLLEELDRVANEIYTQVR